MSDDMHKPEHARECGKPGRCEWCDSLQLNEDASFFMEEKEESYEGEPYDRGQRLAAEIERLEAEIDKPLMRELKRFREREPLVQAVLAAGFDWIDQGTIALRVPGKLHDALVALAAHGEKESEGT